VSSKPYQWSLLVALTLGLVASQISPPYPKQQLLQHSPTVIAIVLLALASRRQLFSNATMTCMVLFVSLHIFGARYIYTYVPLGESLEWLSLERGAPVRNHYDRLVHLAFGVLAICPAVEAARRFGGLGLGWAKAVAFLFVLAVSAFYESFEWLLTMIAAPELADRYNGQQGDTWDAQKDMALATLGALAALPFVGRSTDSV